MSRFALPFYGFGAALFTLLYWQPPFNSPGISLADLTAFRVATPYQYRVLMPLLARGLSSIAPFSLPFLYALLTFGFTLGLLLAWRAYLQKYLHDKADFYALVLLYPLLWNYVFVSGIRYPWDVPAIFFFVLGVAFIQRDQWRLYYLTFFLACLNRETSCFLIFAFVLLTWKRQPTRWIIFNGLLQLVLWLSVKAALTRLFQHNPGAKIFEKHLAANINFITGILRHPQDSIDWILLTFGWMIILTMLSWRVLPADLKRLLCIAPPFLLGMMLVGDFGQARIHNELVPVLLTPALWSFERLRLHWRDSQKAVQS